MNFYECRMVPVGAEYGTIDEWRRSQAQPATPPIHPFALLEVSLDIESMVTPVFAILIFDDIIGLLKSIRRQNRATMSSAPNEPQGFRGGFRYTGSSTGRSAVCIINDQYSQNQISNCLKN